MNIRIRDILGVALGALLLFPLIFFAVLFLTGTAHIELGVDQETRKELSGYLEQYTPAQDRSDAEQSKLFIANQRKEEELRNQEERIAKEIERLENLKIQNAQLKKEIEENRKRIEGLVGENRELSDQKVEDLARVYGAMKPIEAAPILLSLRNQDIARIMKRIPEVRAQAKLMAALGAMDSNRAAAITKILGWSQKDL